ARRFSGRRLAAAGLRPRWFRACAILLLRMARRGRFLLELRRMGAELVHQHTVWHLLHLAGLQIADLEWTVREPDQPVHAKPERAEHALHFTVLAFLEAERQPDIRTLHLVERRFDGPVANALDRDAAFQPFEIGLRHRAKGAHAVAPRPA